MIENITNLKKVIKKSKKNFKKFFKKYQIVMLPSQVGVHNSSVNQNFDSQYPMY